MSILKPNLRFYKSNSTIKVDIDNVNLPDYTVEGLVHLSNLYRIRKFIIKRSPSGNLHLKVFLLDKIDNDFEKICIQFMLGSDKVRERLNFTRVKHGAKLDDWNILFTRHIDIPLRKRKCYNKFDVPFTDAVATCGDHDMMCPECRGDKK